MSMDFIKKIAEIWREVGVTCDKISQEDVFYSGKKFLLNESIDDYMKRCTYLWLSECKLVAGRYCYGGRIEYDRKILKFKVANDFNVLKFPPTFHPFEVIYKWEKLQNGDFLIYRDEPLIFDDMNKLYNVIEDVCFEFMCEANNERVVSGKKIEGLSRGLNPNSIENGHCKDIVFELCVFGLDNFTLVCEELVPKIKGDFEKCHKCRK